MITILLVSAALAAACHITARLRRQGQTLSMMLGTGFMGVSIVALFGLMFTPPAGWAFPLIFTVGMGLEMHSIWSRRLEDERRQQIAALPRNLGGQA
jgi:hypothetical protein